MSTRVLVVDDSAEIAVLLNRWISAEEDMECVGCCDGADDLLEVVARTEPHVVVLDRSMPGKDPLSALKELVQVRPSARAIIFSGYDDSSDIRSAMDAGAWGYVSKHADITTLLAAIRRVAAGEAAFAR